MQRRYGWKRDPASRLYRMYRPRAIATIFPAAFDLPAAVPGQAAAFGLLDQGNLGSCTGFGCARVAWWGLLAVGPHPQPSPLFQYYNERVLDNAVQRDDGSTITTGLAALKKYGICPETDWPYKPAVFAKRPPQKCYAAALQQQALLEERIEGGAPEIMDALFNQRIPVVCGTDIFAQFESAQAAKTGVITAPPKRATPRGGHCMVICGWDQSAASKCGKPAWKIMNSWGAWGDAGACWIPFDYIAKYASDFWAIPKME